MEDTLLPNLEANIEDQLFFSLDNACLWEALEENFDSACMTGEINRSAYLSLPADGPDLSLERLDAEPSASLHKGSAASGSNTDNHDEQTNTQTGDVRPNLPAFDGHPHQDTPLPTTEHGKVGLRDAKQLLAEQAEERKSKKLKRAMEVSAPRKRARKATKATNCVPPGSAKQHPKPDNASPASPITYDAPPSHLTPPFPPLDPGNTSISTPSLTSHELNLVSALLTSLPVSAPISPTTHYTTTHLTSLTDTIWTALSQDRSRILVLGVHLWTLIHDRVSAWPYAKLRVLAHMGVVPGWWWVRERVVELAGGKVDDGEMEGVWGEHEERVEVCGASGEKGQRGL